jgi:creatinine amidohydrolase
MYLPAQTTTDFHETNTPEVAVLPTGATEQHGPALALGMDFLAAEAFARGVGRDRSDTVVLPTVPVGVSEHHRQFDGTLWVPPEAFEAYVEGIVTSIASHGVRKVVVVNGHGGNTGALRRVGARLRREETAFVAPWNWWDSVEALADDRFDEASGHADAMESSVLLHVDEDLVDEAALEAAAAGASDTWGQSVHGANVGYDTIDFSESGAVGDPTQASREKGAEIFDHAASELDALVAWLADQQFEELLPDPHK